MAQLSNLAETLRDYSIMFAKRNGNETADDLHLLASIHRWDQVGFEEKFSGQITRVQALIESKTGDSIERPTVDDATEKRLLAVFNDEDAWNLARDLISDLFDVSGISPMAMPVRSHPSVERSSESDEGTGSSVSDFSNTLMITASLAERISAGLNLDLAEVSRKIAIDALKVAGIVANSEVPEVVRFQIASSLGLEMVGIEFDGSLSDLVSTVAHAGFEGAERLGTELALALVDVGEWMAAFDEDLTREETDRIDDIRLQLRDQLGDKIRAESDAFHSFDDDFSHLVGMQGVKDELRKRVEFLLVAKRRASRGHKVEVQRSHMAFLGNPGTGKTTVARLYGKLLHDVGLLPSNKLIETDRSGLVGEYIGHSEKKTLDLIDLAEGGVLFIDEAYALADNYGPDRKGYGAEATDVIVKQMEDRRDRLVVIVAGYSKPMQQFLSINPGLRSRIPVILEFSDYTDDELVTIAERIAKRRLLILDENAKTKIRTVMANERDVEGFGNAREVENLLDAAQRNVIARVSSLGNLATSEETSTILSDDIPDATEPVAKRPIGFTPNSFS